ncbi:hypothetical protein BLOT_014440 [Blomia tropicalis]|nr:hypothetical protein BLOT_014440 [Blomia tropicalis]
MKNSNGNNNITTTEKVKMNEWMQRKSIQSIFRMFLSNYNRFRSLDMKDMATQRIELRDLIATGQMPVSEYNLIP